MYSCIRRVAWRLSTRNVRMECRVKIPSEDVALARFRVNSLVYESICSLPWPGVKYPSKLKILAVFGTQSRIKEPFNFFFFFYHFLIDFHLNIFSQFVIDFHESNLEYKIDWT